MFWYYPVPWIMYAIAALIALFALFPRYITIAIRSRIFWMAGALLVVTGMILLPSENHLMGDGFTHLGNPERSFAPTELFDILLHFLVNKVVESSITGYRIITFIAGLFYFLGVLLISRLGENTLHKAIIALVFVCTATIQFYFGYVESYKLLNLFTLYYLYFSWRDLKSKKLSHMPLLFFVLTLLSHFSGIVLLPSLVYLYRKKLTWYIIALAGTTIIAGFVIAEHVDIARVLVPFIASKKSSYSLLSPRHLLDMLNVLILVSPLFFFAFWRKIKGNIVVFLFVALAGSLVFAILVDPKIGAFRDWDLLSVFALPLAGLIALRAPRTPVTVVVILIALTVRIVPWILFNSSLQLDYMKGVVNSDPHYSRQYYNGERLKSWGYILYKTGDLAGAEEAYSRLLTYRPYETNVLLSVAGIQYQIRKYQAAYETYMRCLKIEPDNFKYRYNCAYTAFRLMANTTALKILSEGSEAFRQNPTTARLYAGLLGALGRHEEAFEIISISQLEDTDPYLPYVLAKSCIEMGEFSKARELLSRCIEFEPDNQEYHLVLKSIIDK